MKKLLLTSVLSVAAVAAFGQGAIAVGNNFGKTVYQAPIYGPEPELTTSNIVGQSSLGIPAGTTVYNGPLLQGTGWTIEFYAGPTTATSYLQMTLLTTDFGFQTAVGNAKPAGFVSAANGSLFVQGPAAGGGPAVAVPGGSLANFQVFVWQGVTITDPALALAAYNAGNFMYGASPIETTSIVLASGTATPPNTSFPSFNVAESTPEPATLALAGLGAAGMLLIRRKK
jgi:hypothetical protein